MQLKENLTENLKEFFVTYATVKNLLDKYFFIGIFELKIQLKSVMLFAEDDLHFRGTRQRASPQSYKLDYMSLYIQLCDRLVLRTSFCYSN